jgi:dUTP pyrophosphatase
VKVGIKKLPHGADLALPHYATKGSAGLDLLAAIDEEIELLPGQRLAVPAGIAIELPLGWEAQVRPRSGLALNHGGEIKVILINHGDKAFVIARGHKIAQMVIARHEQAELVETDALSESERGAGGFGSTGMTAKA